MPRDNTLERAETCFDRVSRYATAQDLSNTVCYYLGADITLKMTGEELAKLRACLYSLHKGAMRAGKEQAEYEYRARDANELDAAATALAKQKLAWALDNFDNLTTDDE